MEHSITRFQTELFLCAKYYEMYRKKKYKINIRNKIFMCFAVLIYYLLLEKCFFTFYSYHILNIYALLQSQLPF